MSRKSNEPIVEWTDNNTLFSSAFPDKFLFGQGVPTGLPTQRNWKHFSLYYDGPFDDPLFIARGFNQLQCACCIRNSARNTGKNLATLKSLGVLANSEEFQRQLIWARDHPHFQEAKSLNAKVSQNLSIVGSTIPYSPFERAATRPKLNAIRGSGIKIVEKEIAPNTIFRVVSCLYILYDLTCSIWLKNSTHSHSYKAYYCFTVFFTSD